MLIILVFRAVATSFLWSCAVFQVVTYAPITLFPSPVPKSAFYQALAVQVHYNTLVDKISQDADFLQAALARYLRSSGLSLAKCFCCMYQAKLTL